MTQNVLPHLLTSISYRARTQVLIWLTKVYKQLGENYTKKDLDDFIWATLKAGQVLPGYGHAVLRKTDPRFTVQNQFAQKVSCLPCADAVRVLTHVASTAPAQQPMAQARDRPLRSTWVLPSLPPVSEHEAAHRLPLAS